MYWLDLAIIYFALGAPFGVLRITAKRKVTPFAYLRMASGYLLWPLVAIRNVARFLTTKPAAQVTQIDELESIRVEIETIAFAQSTANELYAFREVFYRYTGLAEAVNAQRTTHNAQSGSFNSSLITHSSSPVRSACIARRDRQKLEAQLTQARRELIDKLASHRSLPALDSLASHLNDTALLESLR